MLHTGEVWCGRKLCEGSIMWQENTQGKCDVAGITRGKRNVAGKHMGEVRCGRNYAREA